MQRLDVTGLHFYSGPAEEPVRREDDTLFEFSLLVSCADSMYRQRVSTETELGRGERRHQGPEGAKQAPGQSVGLKFEWQCPFVVAQDFLLPLTGVSPSLELSTVKRLEKENCGPSGWWVGTVRERQGVGEARQTRACMMT